MFEEELKDTFEEFEIDINSFEEIKDTIIIKGEYKFDLIEIDAAMSYSEKFEDLEEKVVEANSYLQDIAYDNIMDLSDEITEEFEFTSVNNEIIPIDEEIEVRRSLNFIIYIKK